MRLEKKYSIDQDKISWRILDGEAVILNLDSGFYYSLNKIGTRIWELLSKGKTTEEIIDIISSEYKADNGKVRNDTINLFNELKKEDLIKTIE